MCRLTVSLTVALVSLLATGALIEATSRPRTPLVQGTGSIGGCIVDAKGAKLPGVTVVATGESARHTTETTTAGCYELKGLPPGAYRVTARLRGFTNVNRDKVGVTAGTATSLALIMSLSPMCECVLIGGSLAEQVQRADAVLHLRVTEPANVQPDGSVYYAHAAAVLHNIKQTPNAGATVTLLEDQSNAAPLPYDVDDEFVAFLSTARDGFTIVNGMRGLVVNNEKHAMVFRVRDGRIVDAPAAFSQYVGATLDTFMFELRALARRDVPK